MQVLHKYILFSNVFYRHYNFFQFSLKEKACASSLKEPKCLVVDIPVKSNYYVGSRKALVGISASASGVLGNVRVPSRSKKPIIKNSLTILNNWGFGHLGPYCNMALIVDLEKHLNLTLLSLLVSIHLLPLL